MSTWKAPGRSTICPFIVVPEAMEVIAFAQQAFGARLADDPLMHADGSLWNAEILIDDCMIMLGSPRTPDMKQTAFLYLYVPDVDAAYEAALAAGATGMEPPKDRFYGDRAGGVMDMAGNVWWLASWRETPAREDMEREARKIEAAQQAG